MGLDMYLSRCDRRAYGFKDFDIDEVKENKPALYEDLKPYLHKRCGKYYSWESIFEDVGYWRKANAIHRWFVDNVQNGVDNCADYEVSKEQLEDLLEICIEIRDGSKIENPEVAEKLLPTQDGFFFGSTNYDQWYMEYVVNTIDILTKVLETTDFDREMVVYHSSW